MGYTKEEFLSPNFDFMSLIAPESAELVKENLKLHLRGQQIEPYENVLMNKDGEKINAIINSQLIDYEGHRAILSIVTDITEPKRKHTEKALRQSEKRYRKLISKMCNGFALNEIICDRNGISCDCLFLEINPAFELIAGMKANDIVGKTIMEVFPGTESFWVDQCGEIALTGNPIHFKNGSKLFDRYFEVVAYSPKKRQVATVFTDITERVKIENALKESENNFRAIAENANDGILIAVDDGNYVYGNSCASKITGYTNTRLMNLNFKDLAHPNEIKRLEQIYNKIAAGNTAPNRHEIIIIKKNGANVPIELTGSKTLWKGQAAVMILLRDITQRKRFEAAMGKIHNELEHRVQKRTIELQDTAEKLEEKQRELLRHRLDLEKANKELIQTNTALSVLARNIDKKRDEVEKKIAQTIASQIMPVIEDLQNDRIREKSRAKLEVLAAYLNDLTPGVAKGHDIIISLSPMELRVAMMIKNGFKSEEIARLLHISPDTVKTHRRNIRKKLNIKNSNINLVSYLKLKLGKAPTNG
jgi:PAS domain S-box-containing protein